MTLWQTAIVGILKRELVTAGFTVVPTGGLRYRTGAGLTALVEPILYVYDCGWRGVVDRLRAWITVTPRRPRALIGDYHDGRIVLWLWGQDFCADCGVPHDIGPLFDASCPQFPADLIAIIACSRNRTGNHSCKYWG